eukprot:Lankesteria_metandrocarpae@DN2078_c0_g1_i1.p1
MGTRAYHSGIFQRVIAKLVVGNSITAIVSSLFGGHLQSSSSVMLSGGGCGLAQLAYAWNKEGHEAIAMTAMSAIEPQALSQLKRLMHDQDLVDIAYWGHLLDQQYPVTENLHFEYHEEPTPGEYKQECPNGDQCLTKSIHHLYARLSGGSDIPSWQPPSNLKFSDIDALKLLVNLLGDLHQPLHLGRLSDKGGKMLTGNISLANHNEAVSLFDVWDDRIIAKVMMERSYFWNSGWTHVNFLQRGKLTAEKEKWQKTENKAELFQVWAKESQELSRVQCYKNGKVTQNFQFNQSDAVSGFEFVRQRILVAGLRTALVVNSILGKKDTIKLRRGSGVNLGNGERQRPRPLVRASQNWMVNLSINVSILILVLAVALCVSSRLGRRSSSSRLTSLKEKNEDHPPPSMQMASTEPQQVQLAQQQTAASVRDRKDVTKQS